MALRLIGNGGNAGGRVSVVAAGAFDCANPAVGRFKMDSELPMWYVVAVGLIGCSGEIPMIGCRSRGYVVRYYCTYVPYCTPECFPSICRLSVRGFRLLVRPWGPSANSVSRRARRGSSALRYEF